MFTQQRDLFYLYINKPRNEPLSFRESLKALVEVIEYFVKDIVRVFHSLQSKKPARPELKDKVVIFADSYNNYEALNFLLGKFPNEQLLCSGGYVQKMPGALSIRRHLYSYRAFSKYAFLLFIALGRKYRFRHFELILKSYDFIFCFTKLMEGNSPAAIFISNDHYPVSRALMIAAQKLSVPCFYIQHASVSEVFPPLRSSHALLYGEFSGNIYKGIAGSSGKIIPVGNHRFDHLKNAIQNKRPTGKIGIAFNTLDPLDEVLTFCRYVSDFFGPENIIIRAHPAEKRQMPASKFVFSPSREESSLEYLGKIDVLIAGNSSILLEAAAMNVYPFQIYYAPVPDYFLDYYGFIRNGIAEEVKEWPALIQRIQEVRSKGIFDARKRTKAYDQSVDERYEFNVGNHIVGIASEILRGLNPAMKQSGTTSTVLK